VPAALGESNESKSKSKNKPKKKKRMMDSIDLLAAAPPPPPAAAGRLEGKVAQLNCNSVQTSNRLVQNLRILTTLICHVFLQVSVCVLIFTVKL
jgi:hypothetical protein